MSLLAMLPPMRPRPTIPISTIASSSSADCHPVRRFQDSYAVIGGHNTGIRQVDEKPVVDHPVHLLQRDCQRPNVVDSLAKTQVQDHISIVRHKRLFCVPADLAASSHGLEASLGLAPQEGQ